MTDPSNKILCWCKQLRRDDVAQVARDCLAAGSSRAGFIDALAFHVGKTCGFCSEFPEPYIAIAAEQQLRWDEPKPEA